MTGTYLDHVLASLAEGGDTEAIVHGGTRVTYAETLDRVLRVATVLHDQGLRPGDGVAIFVGNRPESVIVELAVHLAGCRLVFVPPEPGRDELAAFVADADVAAFVYDPGFGGHAADLVTHVSAARVLPLDVLFDLAEVVPARRPDVQLTRDDVTTLLYTGGTTGRAKLVTHRHIYYDGLIAAAGRRRADSPDRQRFLVGTLVTHSSGHVSAVTGLLAGATIVLGDDAFDAGRMLDVMGRERITGVVLTPPMLYELLDHPDCPADGFPALNRIHYGSAPTAPARLRQAIERFGPVMRQSYGLTESPVITILEPHEHDPAKAETLRTCGRPLPGMELEVRDAGGAPLTVGQIGEVFVRGPFVMAGYWNSPERTAEVIRDGWLATGDLGYRDEEGYLYLVDRSKDVIVTGLTSDNVYARLIDDLLPTLPGIRHGAAVGVPDERYGEAVHVFAVADPGADGALGAEGIIARVRDELGALYEPRGVTFVDQLPWTAMGKIDKKALQTAHAAK